MKSRRSSQLFLRIQKKKRCISVLLILAVVYTFLIKNDGTGLQASVNYDEIWMKREEVDLVLKYLVNVNTYLEWGSGGSTANFAPLAKSRAASIEHTPKWCDLMEARLKDEPKKFSKIEYYCVENSTEYEGEGTYPEFKDYIDEVSHLGARTWDFVFIDGRCRVCAAIKALSYISHNSIVVLHDSRRFYDEGTLYTPILNYYEVLESIGGTRFRGVAIMRRKRELALTGKHHIVQDILEEYHRNLTLQYDGRLDSNRPQYV